MECFTKVILKSIKQKVLYYLMSECLFDWSQCSYNYVVFKYQLYVFTLLNFLEKFIQHEDIPIINGIYFHDTSVTNMS